MADTNTRKHAMEAFMRYNRDAQRGYRIDDQGRAWARCSMCARAAPLPCNACGGRGEVRRWDLEVTSG